MLTNLNNTISAGFCKQVNNKKQDKSSKMKENM